MKKDLSNCQRERKIKKTIRLRDYTISKSRSFGTVLKTFHEYGEGALDVFSQYYRVKLIMLDSVIKPRDMDLESVEIEGGRRRSRDDYRKAAYQVKNTDGTGVVKQLFYSEKRNEATMECSVVLSLLTDSMAEGSSILIVNPSPIFLEQWFNHYYKKYSVVFAILNEDEKGLLKSVYENQFKEKIEKSERFAYFINLEDLYTKTRNLKESGFELTGYDFGIFFVRDIANQGVVKANNSTNTSRYSMGNFFEMLNRFLGNSYKQALVYGPKKLCTEDSFRQALIKNQKQLQILYRCENRIICRPNQALFDIRPVVGDVPYEAVSFYTISVDDRKKGKKWECEILDSGIEIPYDDFVNAKRDVMNQMRWAETRLLKENKECRTITQRNCSDTVIFSDEIRFSCSYSPQNNPKFFVFNYRSCVFGSKKNGNCKRFKKSIEKYNGNKQLALEDGLYDSEQETFICEELIKRHKENPTESFSLKTIWFLIRQRLLKNSIKKYDDTRMKFLFGVAGVKLAGLTKETINASTLLMFVEEALQNKSDSALMAYYDSLNEVFKMAIQLNFLTENHLPEIRQQLSSGQSLREQLLSNALVKKYLNANELGELIQKSLSNYAFNYAYLMCAMRLYTGISIRECCALSWRDIEKNELGFYAVRITKDLRCEDGKEKITEYTVLKDLVKRRTIPLVHPIDMMLIKYKERICRLHSVTEESLRDMPVFLSECASDYTKVMVYKKATQDCKKILKFLSDDNLILFLPSDDEGQEREKDLRRYHGDILNSNFRYYAKVEMCISAKIKESQKAEKCS